MSNQIGDQGAQAMAQALRINQSLITLNLSFNEIGAEGAQASPKHSVSIRL